MDVILLALRTSLAAAAAAVAAASIGRTSYVRQLVQKE